MNPTGNSNKPAIMTSDNVTAVPKDYRGPEQADLESADPDMAAAMDFGEMNEEDARESGYMDENGKAVSKARHDVEGSPTGAYTDIGAGRSSAVHQHEAKKSSQSEKTT